MKHLEIISKEGKIEIGNKAISELDKFVFEITSKLAKLTDYVIVSGYIAILFGRSRTTEDIDILIKPIEFSAFVDPDEQYIIFSSQFTNDENTETIPEQYVLNVKIIFPIYKEINLAVLGKNLFNNQYLAYYNQISMGCFFRFKVGLYTAANPTLFTGILPWDFTGKINWAETL